MHTSAVIHKKRLLHKNKIARLLHNYNGVEQRRYGVEQRRFRKLSQSSVKNVKNNYREKTRSFLPVVQILTSFNG